MMVAAASAGVAVRTLLSVLFCVTVAAFVYGFSMDGDSFCVNLRIRWLPALLTDFYINMAIIGAWVIYKESSWIRAAVLLVLFCTLGGIATCGYIVVQFFKLSPEESSKDPIYFVLARHQNQGMIENRKRLSVIVARVIFSALGCLMLGALIYTIIVHGSPFHAEMFTPCFVGTLIDFFVNVVVLSVWIAYKESSVISAFFWILFLVCCGSIAICAYIVLQLFYLSPQQPASLIIFSNNSRDLQSSDPLLIEQPNVSV